MAGISIGGAILLAVLAFLVIAGALLGLSLARGASLSDIDFEWNPFSYASRAARAEQAGQYGQALLLYAAAGRGAYVLDRMQANLPNWPVREALLAATKELLDLGQSSLNPRAGIPAPVRDRLASYLESAGTVVWTTADHVAAAGTLATGRPKGLERETAKIEQLLQAVHGARDSLADLTLSGGGTELQNVEQDFRKLSDVAESLAAEDPRAGGA